MEYVPPPGHLPAWRRVLSWLPGFCGYCGKRYRKCSDPTVTMFAPLVSHGRCCPDSHEGYFDRFHAFAGPYRERHDNVKAKRRERDDMDAADDEEL